jgi:myosin-5
LPYLHEPAILFCLQERFVTANIYTYTGPILIALNPFKSVPLYSTQTLEAYYSSGLLRSQGIEVGARTPHVFAIADAAYREMMRLMLQSHSYSSNTISSLSVADQSILISGESGAGKVRIDDSMLVIFIKFLF